MIKVNSLVKKYGTKYALDNFDFESTLGEITGLLGPNGSGKTTFMKITAGITPQTSGSITIGGFEPSRKSKEIVSYLPDKNHLINLFSVEDCINFYKDNFKDFNYDKFISYKEIMKIPSKTQLSSLSKGVLQKFRLALCLSRDCSYYLLDEPLDGIDPVTRETIGDTISQSVNSESCIVISTHLISEIEHILDKVVFIDKGNSVLNISCDELREKNNMSVNDKYKEVFADA